jgi:MGT family glycosyltransferase
MEAKKKIMVIVPTLLGHLNPICGLIHELCKNKSIEVLFYSDETYRELIEKTGATFRLHEKNTFGGKDPQETLKVKRLGEMLDSFIGFAYDQLPQYIAEVEKEKPDLILYDGFSFAAKYLIEVIKARHSKGDKSIPIPKTALFSPNFPFSVLMLKTMAGDNKNDIWTALSLANAFRKQLMFSWHFGISVYNPIKVFVASDEKLNLVGVNSELQPYRDFYNDTFKFIGSCISEETRKVDLKADFELNAFLTPFDKKPNDLKLVFMSLGSLFHGHFSVYDKAIEGFLKYDEKASRHFKSSQFKVIISVGSSLAKFDEKIAKGELDLPKNILLRSSVPQLEVLKRADLFITHCGMNSTLETIKYAVPIIALPIKADQPVNAVRICDELSFGIRLQTDSFSPEQLADSVDQVLSDSKFKANVERMSEISTKYNGAVDGAKILSDYLYE